MRDRIQDWNNNCSVSYQFINKISRVCRNFSKGSFSQVYPSYLSDSWTFYLNKCYALENEFICLFWPYTSIKLTLNFLFLNWSLWSVFQFSFTDIRFSILWLVLTLFLTFPAIVFGPSWNGVWTVICSHIFE